MAGDGALSFVEQLPEEARKDLAAIGLPRSYPRGAVLFREDDDGSQVMVLQQGQVKVAVSAPSGREVILGIFDTGDLLGEISAVDGGARSATVTALTDAEVLVLSHDVFVDFLLRHGDAATALLQLVVAKLRGTTRRQLEFGTADSLGRLCRALLELADRYGERDGDGRRFTMPITQQDLASYAGLSREAVVKGLAALRTLEWVRTTGREIALVDEPAIAARAERFVVVGDSS